MLLDAGSLIPDLIRDRHDSKRSFHDFAKFVIWVFGISPPQVVPERTSCARPPSLPSFVKVPSGIR